MIKFKGNKRTLPPVAILNKTKPGRITLSDVKMHHTVLEVQPNEVLTFTDRLKELSIANRIHWYVISFQQRHQELNLKKGHTLQQMFPVKIGSVLVKQK